MNKEPICLFWHRRDLRLKDNSGLYRALKSGFKVLPIFIFDRNILDDLENKKDARVQFIHDALLEMQAELKNLNSSILVKYGKPSEIFPEILNQFNVKAVYTNHDYEPAAQKRDALIAEYLFSENIEFKSFKDQVIFEQNEVLKDDGKPYTVFTPYKNKWLKKCNSFFLKPYPNEKYQKNYFKTEVFKIPSLEEIGFQKSKINYPEKYIDENIIENYSKNRDFPNKNGTSQLSVHLRFGTIGLRILTQKAALLNDVYLNELIWRDFYQMILFHFPHVVGNAFKAKYDRIPWQNNEADFKKWCDGKTGYPIVDAGMRQLNQTGFMHNRVRMIVASFLCKHLLIDWRWGEAYFAEKLLDFDLASNNGGWQWAAGSGCDAAPYFRVFSPDAQTKKFDSNLEYIKTWVPEVLDPFRYPKPMVEHKFARKRAIETYKAALS